MCRWGCLENQSTFLCKWCGTRYCRECLRGDFVGNMKEATVCKVCNQMRCQGKRVEVFPPYEPPADAKGKGKKGKGKGGKKEKAGGKKKGGKKKKK